MTGYWCSIYLFKNDQLAARLVLNISVFSNISAAIRDKLHWLPIRRKDQLQDHPDGPTRHGWCLVLDLPRRYHGEGLCVTMLFSPRGCSKFYISRRISIYRDGLKNNGGRIIK